MAYIGNENIWSKLKIFGPSSNKSPKARRLGPLGFTSMFGNYVLCLRLRNIGLIIEPDAINCISKNCEKKLNALVMKLIEETVYSPSIRVFSPATGNVFRHPLYNNKTIIILIRKKTAALEISRTYNLIPINNIYL